MSVPVERSADRDHDSSQAKNVLDNDNEKKLVELGRNPTVILPPLTDRRDRRAVVIGTTSSSSREVLQSETAGRRRKRQSKVSEQECSEQQRGCFIEQSEGPKVSTADTANAKDGTETADKSELNTTASSTVGVAEAAGKVTTVGEEAIDGNGQSLIQSTYQTGLQPPDAGQGNGDSDVVDNDKDNNHFESNAGSRRLPDDRRGTVEDKEKKGCNTSKRSSIPPCTVTVNELPSSMTLTGNTSALADPKPSHRGERRQNSPFSPGAMRARVVGFGHYLLRLGSEAQVAPVLSPLPAGSEHADTAKAQSPISWTSRTVGRNKGSARKKMAPAFFDSGDHHSLEGSKPFVVDDVRDNSRLIVGGSLNSKIAHDGAAASSSRRERIHGQGSEAGEVSMAEVGCSKKMNDGRATENEGKAEMGQADCGCNTIIDESAEGKAYEIAPDRTSDSTDRHDRRPSPLDNEADSNAWALGEGEREVLKAARRAGSVLARVVTWNLHAKPTPGAKELRSALLPPGKFHIFAVGTEECLNSIAKSVIVHSKKEWESRLKETLGASYEMLCGHSLQATHNAIFAHRGIVPLLRNVRSFAVATGLSLGARGTTLGTLGTLGNKGGVGIAFDIGATACVFVNSHLAAHQTNVTERNEQFFQIQHDLVRALVPPPTPFAHVVDASRPPAPLGPMNSAPTAETHRFRREGGDALNQGSSVERNIDKVTRNSGEIIGLSKPLAPTMSIPDEAPLCHTPRVQTSVPPAAAIAKEEPQNPETRVEGRVINAGDTCTPESALDQSSLSYLDGVGGSHVGGGSSGFRRGDETLPEVFDRVVWAGDLNYRVNVPRAVADQLLAEGMHDVLIKNEQLGLERAKGGRLAPFAGYQEGPLNFPPTYKFDSGTDTYDSSSKQRVPAWTDRVLFAGGENTVTVDGDNAAGGLELRAYRSVEELKTSDHRPVLASFVIHFDQKDSCPEGGAVMNQTSSEVCTAM